MARIWRSFFATLMLVVVPLQLGAKPNPKAKLQLARKISHAPAGMTITPSGDIILSLHQYYRTVDRAVIMSADGGEVRPFPNEAISRGLEGAEVVLDSVQGIQCDKKHIVWMLDNGRRSEVPPKIVAWNLKKDALEKVIPVPPDVLRPDSFVNDLLLDPEGPFIYISDPAGGYNAAVIVVDHETGVGRRLLEGHYSVVPEEKPLTIDGLPVEVQRVDGKAERPQYGVNPIAVDRKGEMLYFGPLNGTTLYRIETKLLKDQSLSTDEIASRVQGYARKPKCDGITIDAKGNIYLTDLTEKAICVIEPDNQRRYRQYLCDPLFEWPDGLCYSGDGKWFYFFTNQIHKSAMFNKGKDKTQPPFYIFRFKGYSSGHQGT